MTRLAGILLLTFSLTTAGFLQPTAHAAGEPKKGNERDARQTVNAYLDAVLAGKVETAAALAVPGSVEGSKERIAQYRDVIGAKTIKLASVHASAKKDRAFAVTEVVPLTKVQRDGRDKGPLVIKLTKANGYWYVRDVDFKSEETAKQQLQQFLKMFPDAKPVPQKQ